MMNTIHVVVVLLAIFNSELGTGGQAATLPSSPTPSTTTPPTPPTPPTTTTTTTPTPTPSTTPTPPPFHQGPQYTINCLETGYVEVKGVSDSSLLTVIGNNQSCENSNTTYTATSGKITISKSCLTATQLTALRSVTFTIHDSTFDGTNRIKPNETVVGLNGGQNLHTITVHCKSLRDRGMQVYVVHGVGLATPEPKNIPTEIKKVEMRLKSEKYNSYTDVTELPDVSTVYIGDKFYMYLVYLGKDQYSVVPTECTAFDGAYASEPSSSVPKLDLYTNSRCLSQNAKDYRVMHPFRILKVNETRIVSAEMYGFTFNSDKEITFVCTVKICKGGDTCHIPDCDGKDWSSSRRRRSTTKDKQFTITKRLRVERKTVQNSAGIFYLARAYRPGE